MISQAIYNNASVFLGSPLLRTYDSNSFAQQAVTFLCLDFNGQTTRHSELPKKVCPSGVRAQIVSNAGYLHETRYQFDYMTELSQLLGWQGMERI